MQNFYDVFLSKYSDQKNKLKKRELKKITKSFEEWLDNNPYYKKTILSYFKSDDEIINLIYKYYLYIYDPEENMDEIDKIKNYFKFIELIVIDTFSKRKKTFFKFNNEKDTAFIRSNLNIEIQSNISKNDRELLACTVNVDFMKEINNYIEKNTKIKHKVKYLIISNSCKILKKYAAHFIFYEDFYNDNLVNLKKMVGKIKHEHSSKSNFKSARK